MEDLRTIKQWDTCRHCGETIGQLTNDFWVHRLRGYQGNSLPLDQLCDGLKADGNRTLATPMQGTVIITEEEQCATTPK